MDWNALIKDLLNVQNAIGYDDDRAKELLDFVIGELGIKQRCAEDEAALRVSKYEKKK